MGDKLLIHEMEHAVKVLDLGVKTTKIVGSASIDLINFLRHMSNTDRDGPPYVPPWGNDPDPDPQ